MKNLTKTNGKHMKNQCKIIEKRLYQVTFFATPQKSLHFKFVVFLEKLNFHVSFKSQADLKMLRQ